jgi:uncharacterized delta-60 repeat protein
VAGSSCCRTESDFTLARSNHDGTLDSSFGIEGMVTTDFDSYYEAITSIAILGYGKIVAVGRSGYDLAVVRYNHHGSLDTAFGNEGKVTTHFGGYRAEASAVAIQADGKIVAAGTWTIGCLGRAPDQTHNPLLRLCRSRRPAVVPLRLQTPGPGPLRSSGR